MAYRYLTYDEVNMLLELGRPPIETRYLDLICWVRLSRERRSVSAEEDAALTAKQRGNFMREFRVEVPDEDDLS